MDLDHKFGAACSCYWDPKILIDDTLGGFTDFAHYFDPPEENDEKSRTNEAISSRDTNGSPEFFDDAINFTQDRVLDGIVEEVVKPITDLINKIKTTIVNALLSPFKTIIKLVTRPFAHILFAVNGIRCAYDCKPVWDGISDARECTKTYKMLCSNCDEEKLKRCNHQPKPNPDGGHPILPNQPECPNSADAVHIKLRQKLFGVGLANGDIPGIIGLNGGNKFDRVYCEKTKLALSNT